MNELQIRYAEVSPDPDVLDVLIGMSEEWEAENSCRGYRKNGPADVEGNRIFLAQTDGSVLGYLFGHVEKAENASSVMPDGTPFFEVEEIYVKPAFRCKGIGKKLFSFAEQTVSEEVEYILLGTATKNWKAILHFYIDELGMEFWSARLFRKCGGERGV